MKKWIVGLMMMIAGQVFADSNLACGLQPLPPIGCSNSNVVCSCDMNGTCQWVFSNCK